MVDTVAFPEPFPSEPGAGDGDRSWRAASQRPPRRPQPRPARGGRAHRRAAAGHRRRRLGQDPGAHPPHRPPHPRRARLAVRDPRHHLHQQGRRRDEAPRRRAGRSGRPEDVGVHVPLGVRAHPAPRRQGARVPVVVHDLRPGRRRAPHRLRHPRPEPRPQEVPAARRARRRSARPRTRACRRRRVQRPGAGRSSSARSPRSTASTRPACCKAGAMDFDDLLGNTVQLFREHPDVLEHYQQRFQHVLVDEYQDTNPVQNELVLLLGAEHRNICVVGDSDQSIYRFRGADIRNILEFEQAFPDATVDRARAELPVDPDHPRRRQRGHRQQPRAQAQGAVDRAGPRRADRPLPRRRRGRRGAVGRAPDGPRCTTTGRTAGATSPSSTAPTPRAGCSRSSSCGSASRTRSSAAPASTTGARSRTRSPTCGRSVNPADEVSVKRVLNIPKRGVGDTLGRPARRLGRGPRRHVPRGAAPRRRRRRVGQGASRASRAFLDAASTSSPTASADGPAAAARGRRSSAVGLPRRARGRALASRPRAASRTWPSWSASAHEFERVDEFLEQVSLVADTDELERRRVVGRADDAALGQGPRVPGRVPHRPGGRRLPPPALDRRARPARGGAPPRLRRASPAAEQRLYLTHAWCRTLFGGTQYNPPSRFLDEIPAELVTEVAGQPAIVPAGGRVDPGACARRGVVATAATAAPSTARARARRAPARLVHR